MGTKVGTDLESLPEDAQKSVKVIEGCWKLRLRPHPTRHGYRFDRKQVQLILLTDAHAPHPSVRLLDWVLLLLYPFALALAIWAVVMMRWDDVSTKHLAAAGGLVFVAACGISFRKLQSYRRGSQALRGLLLAPHGLTRIDGENQYRYWPRNSVGAIEEDNGVHLRLAEGTATKVLDRAFADTRAALLQSWLRDEAISYHGSGAIMPRWKRPATEAPLAVFGWCFLAAFLSGFAYLTMVMPGRSEAGENSKKFLTSIKKKDYDSAYAMLTPHAQKRLSRDEFVASLPDEFTKQTGVSINGIHVASGTNDESRGCIDGWLSGVSSKRFRVLYQSKGSTWRIHRYELKHCGQRTWSREFQDAKLLE